jgi:MFS family permease
MAFKCLIKNKFISTIIGTIGIFMSISFLMALGNFSVYMTSYIHYKQEFVTMHYGMFINLIFSFANSLSHPLGGFFENSLGFFKTIILGSIITSISNIFFILQRNIWICYLIAIFLGMGAGISTSLLGKNLIFYSPNKKGVISGILSFGVLIIVAIFALGGEKIIAFKAHTIEDDEEFYPEEIAERIKIYLIIGEFFIPIGLIIGLLFLYEYKAEENGENKEKGQETIEQKNSENPTTPEETKSKIKQVLFSLRFWRIASISFLIHFSISFMMNTGRTFGSLIGIDGTALQFAGVFQTLTVVIIGPILGLIVDKKGPLIIMIIASVSCIIPNILLTFYMDVTIIFISAFMISILGVVELMISFGPFIMEVFGIQESVILGGIITGISKIGDIITTVTAFIISIPNDEEMNNPELKKENLKKAYKVLYLISAVSCFMSTILLFFESKEKFNYETKTEQPSPSDQKDIQMTIISEDNTNTKDE